MNKRTHQKKDDKYFNALNKELNLFETFQLEKQKLVGNTEAWASIKRIEVETRNKIKEIENLFPEHLHWIRKQLSKIFGEELCQQ